MFAAQGKQKHYYDKKTKNRQFQNGQRVLALLPTDHNKLTLQWKGPYEVQKVLNKMDYRVNVDGKIKVYHANLLKRYCNRDEDLAGVAIEEAEDMTEVSVIDLQMEEPDFAEEDQDLLELSPLGCKDTIEDAG